MQDAVIYAEIVVRGCCFGYFARHFLRKKKTALYASMLYCFIMSVLYIMPLHIKAGTAYITGIAAVFIFICCKERQNYNQKLFIVEVFYTLNWFAAAMAEILYDNLYSFILDTNYMAGHTGYEVLLYVSVCIFYIVMEFLFTMAGSWCIIKIYKNKYADMSKKELFMLAMPSFMGITGYYIIYYYRIFSITEAGKALDIYDALAILYCLASVITIIVVVVLYHDIKTKQEENLQAGLLAAQADNIRKHIKQVESLYQNIRSTRHDMANHILILEKLYTGNKTDEAAAYSKKLKENLASMSGGIKSGNPVTDVILQEFKEEAEKMGIGFCTEFYYPEGAGIDVFDISIILNNALQNAIENTEKDSTGFISVISYRRNNAYMIEVKNSFKGVLEWNVENGLPFTSKGNKECHGYGLPNIRRVAGKYYGGIDILPGDGEFCLCIMLMAEQ